MNEIERFLDENFPSNRVFGKFERHFRKLISVDAESLLTKNNLKSSTVIKAETLRHLLFHRNVIHCFSRFRSLWEILMMMTYAMAFIFIPYDVAFNYGHRRLLWSPFLSVITSSIDVICLIDVAVNFRSSYQDHQSKRIVLEGRKIASHYMRYYFWVDLFSSFPDRIIQTWLSGHQKGLIKNHLYDCVYEGRLIEPFRCAWDVIAILSLLKFLQLPLFFKYLTNLLQRYNRSNYFIKILQNLLTLVILYHLIVCFDFLFIRVFVTSTEGSTDKRDVLMGNSIASANFWTGNDFEKYIICLFYTTYTLSLFASRIEEQSQVDMMIGLVLTVIGFVLHIWLVSEAYMFIKTTYWPSVRFREIRYQMQKYMSFKRLSKSIQKRILAFYDFLFNGNFFRKREIDELLGNELRHLVKMETCQRLLKGNYFFKQLPDELLNAMADCLTEVVFLCNDVICKVEAARAQKLYLIVSGTVAVYTEDGEETVHLMDGNMFGETAFLHYDESSPTLNYVATEETVLLVLTRSDFMKVLAETPGTLNNMRYNFRQSLDLTQQMKKKEIV